MQDHLREIFGKRVNLKDPAAVAHEQLLFQINRELDHANMREAVQNYCDIAVVNLPDPTTYRGP
jgi:hypothetical protein